MYLYIFVIQWAPIRNSNLTSERICKHFMFVTKYRIVYSNKMTKYMKSKDHKNWPMVSNAWAKRSMFILRISVYLFSTNRVRFLFHGIEQLDSIHGMILKITWRFPGKLLSEWLALYEYNRQNNNNQCQLFNWKVNRCLDIRISKWVNSVGEFLFAKLKSNSILS